MIRRPHPNRNRERPRYRLWFIPRSDRPLPRYRKDWLRFVLVVALLIVSGTGFATRGWLHHSFTCGAWFDTQAWRAGDRCVGLSSGPYAFGLAAFEAVMGRIEEQNDNAAKYCPGTPVTVGVLLTMTDKFAGNRAVHELEGMAAGQRRANNHQCVHPMRLLVGQLGDYDGNGDAVAVARALAERDEVIAVAGIGLSHQATADVADTLAAHGIPMVSDVATAEGFDQGVSEAEGNPADFSTCDAGNTYHDGIGGDYIYRIGFRVSVQVKAIDVAVAARPDFIMVPTGGSDPYTCTTLPVLHRTYGDNVPEVKFDASEPSTTVQKTAERVCDEKGDVTVAYIARGRDLGRLISSLDTEIRGNYCNAESITVVSTSDANRLRTIESDATLEKLRREALTASSFRDKNTRTPLRVLFSLVHGVSDTSDRPDGNFADFEKAFEDAGFDPEHIGNGWAINAYDAVTTIATALRDRPEKETVRRFDVNTAINAFKVTPNAPERSTTEGSVPGAGGPITFDNSGNRRGDASVVRLCSTGPTPDGTPTVTTVLVPPRTPTVPDCP